MEPIDQITLVMALLVMSMFLFHGLKGERFRNMTRASVIILNLMLLAYMPVLGCVLMSWAGVLLGIAADVWLIKSWSRWRRERDRILNKAAGFGALKEMGIPTVDWVDATPETELDPNILWTVRTAVIDQDADDMSLPRNVGVPVDEAKAFIKHHWNHFGTNIQGHKLGMFITYPYFHADYSGTLLIEGNEVTIEGCVGDLWNLVDDGHVDFRLEMFREDTKDEGLDWLKTDVPANVAEDLIASIAKITRYMREDIRLGNPVLLEWSACRHVDDNGEPLDEEDQLIFYEARVLV